MAKRGSQTSAPDPITALAVGVAADHAAAKAKADEKGGDAEDEARAAGSPDDEAKALGEVVKDKVDEAVSETPPAPGEDADSVFGRRIDRMIAAVDETEFESGTAFGDLRDCMIELFKSRPKPWHMMSNDEQRTAARAVEGACQSALHKVVVVVASAGAHTIHATMTDKLAVAGTTVEAKIKVANVDNDVLGDLFGLAGKAVVLIAADDKAFMAARREPQLDPDQLGMAFADDPAAPPPPPAEEKPATMASQAQPGPEGDDDLAGDDWGVFNSTRKEWLVDEDDESDDAWTVNSRDAKRFSHHEATSIAESFEDTGVGIRKLGDDPAPEAVQQPAAPEDDEAE